MGEREKRRWRLIGGEIFQFDGLDMRSRRARRLKKILSDLIAEFGSARPHALRELAGYRLALDAAVETNVLVNKPVTREDAVRMSNVAARIERELRANHPRPDQTPSLHEYLAKRQGGPQAAETPQAGHGLP